MADGAFLIDNDDRYARLRLIGWWDQSRLQKAKVMVVGAGALGNEVLKNLALLGCGTIYIVDFDEVEHANLARTVLFRARDCGRPKAEVAAEALREMNPDSRVVPLPGDVLLDVGLGYFYETDVVISCLDNREARLWVNRCCWKTNTPWVDGAIQEINGVVKVFVPPDSACYECGMTEVDYRLINLRYSCPLLRQEDMQAGKVPTAPTIASMIGGLQTQEAVKLLHGLPTASGEALVFNGVANQFYRTRFQRRDDCLSHETYPPPISAPLPALTTTACQLMEFLRQQRPEADGLRLVLDRDLVVSLECVTCGVKQQVMRPLPAVSMREGACPQCRQPMRPEVQHTVTGDSSLATQTLTALGVPRFDIVRLESAEDEFAVLLAADRQPEARHAPSTSG